MDAPSILDFETGTLQDWTAQGDAFTGQPIEGDTVFKRRGDMKSQHQGHFWIGSYERKGDKAQGTLTSATFPVTHPWGSFMVGGGTDIGHLRRDRPQRHWRRLLPGFGFWKRRT